MSRPPDRIAVHDVTPAGGFSAWLARTRRALASDDGADVPCGGCTACCTAAYYVYVREDETRALARIPSGALVPLPGLPDGTVAIGFDENGHCPMLRDGACSIYDDRPQTCRNFDCRIFPAAGIAADKPLIAARAARWRFEHPTAQDRTEHAAVRAAAGFLREHADQFTTWAMPRSPNRLAVLAIKAAGAFVADPERMRTEAPAITAAAIVAEVKRLEGG